MPKYAKPILAIDDVLDKAGGVKPLAQRLGITHQAVYAWMKKGHVPLTRAAQIEALFGVNKLDLISPELARALDAPNAASSVL